MARGGTRPGAGRKRKAQTHEGAIKRAEKRCADRLPESLQNLEKIANGGFPIIEETWEPAGRQTIETVRVVEDVRGNEKAVKCIEKAFPDLEPDELVLVKRTTRKAAPDRAANEYLINRVMGAPTQKHEFSSLSDAELLEEAKSLFGRTDAAGDSPAESL